MAEAVNSIPAPIFQFPADRARAPGLCGPIYDRASYDHCFVASHVAQQFEASPDATVRAVLLSDEGDGAHALACTLEHNRQAISFLRAALANLLIADRRISAAADRVLAGAGL